jgi:hypothetical protein
MTRVAGQLVGRELAVCRPRQAAVLPRVEAASQIVQVLIAHLAQRSRRQQRARARGTLQDDRRLVVGHFLLDPQFEEAAGDADRLRNMPLAPFVALADIEQYRAGLLQHPPRLLDIDRFNLGARLVENVL